MYKKKCSPMYVCFEHPLMTAAVMGFAIFGMVGMVMALKKKAKPLMKTAEQVGCACMDNVREKAEDILEGGMETMQRMMHRRPGYRG